MKKISMVFVLAMLFSVGSAARGQDTNTFPRPRETITGEIERISESEIGPFYEDPRFKKTPLGVLSSYGDENSIPKREAQENPEPPREDLKKEGENNLLAVVVFLVITSLFLLSRIRK